MRFIGILVALGWGCAPTELEQAEPVPVPEPEEPAVLTKDDRASVRLAVADATGRDPGEDVCAVWPESFPRVVVVGTFAHDAGCMHEGVFVDRTWYGSKGSASAGLVTAGWGEASMQQRQALAQAWVEEVSQAFGGRFVKQTGTAFELEDTPDFRPVHVRPTKVRGVVVEGWVAEPSGMVFEEAYRFVQYRFGSDGGLTSRVAQRFSVPGEVIRERELSEQARTPEKK